MIAKLFTWGGSHQLGVWVGERVDVSSSGVPVKHHHFPLFTACPIRALNPPSPFYPSEKSGIVIVIMSVHPSVCEQPSVTIFHPILIDFHDSLFYCIEASPIENRYDWVIFLVSVMNRKWHILLKSGLIRCRGVAQLLQQLWFPLTGIYWSNHCFSPS